MNKTKVVSHYVDNSAFTEKLGAWTARNRALSEQGLLVERITDDIASDIIKICQNIVKRASFANYTFREEMEGDAIETCIRYAKNFDGTKSTNAFGYISRIAYTAVLRRIKKEKLLTIKHIKYIKNIVDVNELSNVVTSASNQEQQHYQSYLSSLKNIIDEVADLPEEEAKKKPKKNKEQSILLAMMEEGEEL